MDQQPLMPRAVLANVVVAALYGVLACLILWPLPIQLSTHFAGQAPNDSREFVWGIWWWQTALASGHDPTFFRTINHPDGAAFPLMGLMAQSFVTAQPLSWLLSPVAALNVMLLLSFPLSGLAAFNLCRHFTSSVPASFIGGLIWAFFPNRIGHVLAGHLVLVHTWALPWLTLCWLQLVERPNKQRVALAAVAMVTAATLHPIFLAYFVAPVLVFITLAAASGRVRAAPWRQWLRPMAAALAVSGLAVAVLAWPTVSTGAGGNLRYLEDGGSLRFSLDAAALWLPPPDNPFWAATPVAELGAQATRYPFEGLATLGWVTLLLSAAAWWQRPDLRVWGWLVVGGVVLALGPVLHWGGSALQVAIEPQLTSPFLMPYAYIGQLPFFNWSRTPARLIILATLAFTVLASAGTEIVLRRVEPRWARAGLGVIVALLINGEYLVRWPFPTYPLERSPVAEALAQSGEPGAILSLPWGGYDGDQLTLFWQTIHGRPLVGGRAFREIPAVRAVYFGLQNLALDALPDKDAAPIASDPERRWALSISGARWLLVDRTFISTDQAARLELRFGPPQASDDRLSQFELPGPVGDPGPTPDRVWSFASGWQPPLAWGAETLRWMERTGDLVLVSGADQFGYLQVSATPGEDARLASVYLNGEPVARLGIGAWGRYVIGPVGLRRGPNWIRIEMDRDADRIRGDWRCRRQSPVYGAFPVPVDCDLNESAWHSLSAAFGSWSWTEGADLPLDTGFGESLRLRETVLPARSVVAGERVWIQTAWSAPAQIDSDLIVFVHVIDENGQLRAQADGQPGSGVLPTFLWGPNASVRVVHALDLPADLAPGRYTLRLGVYEQTTIARLPVTGPGAQDNTLLLGTLQVTP